MQAVKLRPEEVLGGVVRSDWLLLWRLLPKGLPSKGDAGGRDSWGYKASRGNSTYLNGSHDKSK